MSDTAVRHGRRQDAFTRTATLMMVVGCVGFLTACGASSTSSTAALNGTSVAPALGAAPDAGNSKQNTTAALATPVSAQSPAAPARVSGGAIASVPPVASGNGNQAAAPSPAVIKAIDTLTAANKPGSSAYKIGPQDLLEISVFKVPDLSKMVQVAESGTINLPLLGEVQATGQTARELEHQLTISLGAKYLQNPQVTVYIREYNSQRVTFEGGGIKKPGVYALKGRMTLLQLVATAEGLSEISDSEMAIFRQKGEKKEAARFNVASLRNGEAEDPELMAGDVIVASTSATKEVFNNVIRAVPIATALRPF